LSLDNRRHEEDCHTTPNTEETERTRDDISETEVEYFGDQISGHISSNILRIGFININGFPVSAQDPKNKQILNIINKTKLSIIGMVETNRCWHKLSEKDKWQDRTRGWWETQQTILAYNHTENISSDFQPGGTLLTSINRPAHRIIETGKDDEGLGRWVWTLYRGRHDVTLRIISAYRPCKPHSAGPSTTYSQQRRYMDRNKDNRCPRDAILQDLGNWLTQWRAEGNQLIVMMDCNEDVTSPVMTTWLHQHGLRNSILDKHQITTNSTPTYHRGSHAIDGIFTSSTINIVKGGYMPFGAFPSDHRGLWIDINYDNAFGYNMPKTITPSARRLKSDDPRIRNKWITSYTEFIKQHKLHTKQFEIEHKILHHQNEGTYNDSEKIRRLRLQGIKYADKRCRKLTMGGVPFSAEYSEITTEMELWKAIITKKQGCKFSMSKLRRLSKKAKIIDPLGCTLEEARAKLNEITARYWEFKKTAKDTRSTFLESKASAIAEEKGQEASSIYHQLIRREKQRESARRIKYTLGKLRGGGITRVEVETQDGAIREVTTKVGIERECMLENKKKFRQTQSTPCMTEPLRSELGKFGNTVAGQQILDGSYTPPANTNQYTREFFKQLQKPPQIFAPPLQATMTTKEFQSGWKRMKEKTSAGISGIHFGHMKTCAQDDFLSNFEASLAQVPYVTGQSPSSWQVGVNVMIQKKARVDLVNKLRTITLTEADFNFNNKFLGKHTIAHAEKHNLLAKEQYGSRKGKNSIEHAIHKRLTFDIMRQTRINGAVCSNDAKSCYDRIIHSLACLAYRRLGVPKPPVECMFQSIQNMKHHIRTTFGDSSFSMDSTGTLIPFQGVLQGNGASPATWVILSTPLLNMLRSAGNGGYFISPISKKTSQIVGYSFVDDTDLLQYDARDPKMTVDETMDNMQSAIDRWEGGLKTTGGAIVPEKSFVYPIAFEFDAQGKWSYQTNDTVDYVFTVCDHNDERKPLRQLEPSNGQCTLGVHLAPDGNNNDAIEYLTQKATQWKDLITTGHLQRADAWLALESTILKTLQYPLPALTLSEKECNRIIRPVLDAGLNKASICKKFPKAVIHGPNDEGGLNITNLYTHQGISRIEILQDHLGTKDMMDELLTTSIELAKVEIGVGRNLFSLDFPKYEHILTDCWVKETWRYAHENNIEIKDTATKNLQLHRENDVFLMEIIAHHGYTKTTLQKINRCRLYLQVTTLSDIVCGYGTQFTKAYNCIYNHTIPHHYKWPNQPRPGQAAIKAWKKALKECFPKINGDIEYKVGKWLYAPSTEWKWFFSPRTTLIYQKQGRLWRVWKRCSRAGYLGNTPRYKYYTNGLNKPRDSVRASICRQGAQHLQMTGWKEHENDEPYTLPLSDDINWILTETTQPIQLNNICESITNGSIKAVSDGSYLSSHRIGSAAWIIESPDKISQCTGKIHCPGPANIQGSHRSELIGILGIITHINKICNTNNIRRGGIEIGCDGQGALNAIQSNHLITKSTWKHFDIIKSIRHSMKQSTLNWTLCHVKGHQDDDTEYNQLNRWAQLNVLVDKMAKEKLSTDLPNIATIRQRPFYLPFETCGIYWYDRRTCGFKICSELRRTLTFLIHTNGIREYWRKKHKFSGYTESFVDWELTQRSRRNISKARQRWMSKWMAGFCGVGIMLVRYAYQKHSRCPRCNQSNEDTAHIIQCPHPDAVNLWTQEVSALHNWMIQSHGHPELCTIIKDSLLEWRSTSKGYQDKPIDVILQLAVKRQKNIGWRSLIEGFWSKEWRQCQSQYLISIKSRRSSLLWISRVQRKIWEIAWKMWDQRNQILHNNGETIHTYEMKALDIEIREEMRSGLNGLHRKYQHLFHGTTRTKLEMTLHHKRMWIMSIWAARDNTEEVYNTRQRDNDIEMIYNRWKKNNRRPIAE
jgi:hypothetical protein